MPKKNSATFPPPPPKLRTKPRVKGSVVTGFTQTGTFGFPQCRTALSTHGLFKITTDPVPNENSNSGYRQECFCITCGTKFVEVDCEFLMVKATREVIEQMIDKVVAARKQIRKAHRTYLDLLSES